MQAIETKISLPGETPHTLTLRADPATGLLCCEVDGKQFFQTPRPSQPVELEIWFQSDLPGLRNVLLNFWTEYNRIEDVQAWTNLNAEELRGMKRGHLQGCAYYCDSKKVYFRFPWRNFTDDLGAFVATGFRFSLSYLMIVVLLYAFCMALTVPHLPNTTYVYTSQGGASQPVDTATYSYRILILATCWLLCLGLFAGAAAGNSLRYPDAPPERRGWVFVHRIACGLAIGWIVNAICIANFR